MDTHKTKIVEKLVKVLCLVLDTPDGKKMNITGMFDEKEFDKKGDKSDLSKKPVVLPKKNMDEEDDLLHFSPESDIKSPPIKPIVPESARPTTASSFAPQNHASPSSPAFTASPASPEKPKPTGTTGSFGLEAPGQALGVGKQDKPGLLILPTVQGGGRRRYKRRSVRSSVKPKKRSKKKSNKKSKRKKY